MGVAGASFVYCAFHFLAPFLIFLLPFTRIGRKAGISLVKNWPCVQVVIDQGLIKMQTLRSLLPQVLAIRICNPKGIQSKFGLGK